MRVVFAGLLVVLYIVLWTKGYVSIPGTGPDDDVIRPRRTLSVSGADSRQPPPGSEQARYLRLRLLLESASKPSQQLTCSGHSVKSGFSGGSLKDPTYAQVCSGTTGHAEVVQITFDPKVISFDNLLEVFWKTHDPTTRNRQGNSVGPQYRSVIFYHNPEQKELAEQYKQKLDGSGAFSDPIVTEIAPFLEFYAADKSHQNYYLDNPQDAYCSTAIRPKLEKFESCL